MPSKTYGNSPKLLLKWLSNEKEVVYKIYLLALLQGVIYVLIPLCLQGIVTFTMAGKFTASLIVLSLVTVVATLFIGLIQILQMRINETLQQKIFARITDKINSFLSIKHSENIYTKVSQFFEIITLQKGIAKILLDFSFSAISIVFGLLILPAYSSWFLVFTIVLGVSFYFIVTFYGSKALESNLKYSTEKYTLFDWFKALAENQIPEKDATSKSDAILGNYIEERNTYFKTVESQYIGILIFKVIFVAMLLFLGAYLVQIGELNIGQFVASEIIILLIINSVEKLVDNFGTCYDLITALYKIESIFSSQPQLSFLESEQKILLPSAKTIYSHPYSKKIQTLFYFMVGTAALVLFLPWTQNVDTKGYVTTLSPELKPQNITSRIAGRIEKWYIKDGDKVKKNDTIAFISEIKDDYIDPRLIERSESQITSKETSLQSYENKINSIDLQIDALNKALRFKIEQVKNKVQQTRIKMRSDSVDAVASQNNYKVSEEQFKRFEELLVKGVISKTDFENRKVKLQEAMSKMISAENKFINSKNDILNAEIELNSTQQDYTEKLMKAESDKFSTMSMLYDTEGSVTKMQNQLANYSLRKSYYFILAPQDGYINNVAVQGIGEIIKEGGVLCRIVPIQSEQVVELFVNPIDMPLIHKGQTIQLIFDGWPAFVFSGWQGISYGTYSAEIVAFDRVISDNGKFRVLAVNKKEKWPLGIQIGGGVEGFAMLNNVPLVYELWRKINGFPPDFYKDKSKISDADKK